MMMIVTTAGDIGCRGRFLWSFAEIQWRPFIRVFIAKASSHSALSARTHKYASTSLARHLDQRLPLRGPGRNSRPSSHGSLNLASLQAVRLASISAVSLCAQEASALTEHQNHHQFHRHISRAIVIGDIEMGSHDACVTDSVKVIISNTDRHATGS
jgi:hypothetical protein